MVKLNKRIVIMMHSTLCLMAGARRGEVHLSLVRLVEEYCIMQLPINVVLWTIQPLGEAREAVASEEHRAPRLVTLFTPPTTIAARRC